MLKFSVRKQKGKNPTLIIPDKKENTLPYINASAFENYNYDGFVSIEENLPIVNKDEVIVLWDGARAGFVDYNHYGFLSSTMVSLKVNSEYNPCKK